NQNAIEHTVGQWTEGMTWRQLNHEYHMAVMTQGGFVHDPGGMVLAHPRGADSAVSLETGFEEFEIPVGMHVMFDCHGSWNQYNWDGGKLWVAGDDADASTSARVAITAEVMGAIEGAMRPGVRVSELQALGRDIYRRNGCTDADDVLIFFHGLGLSHMDLPEQLSDGRSNGDWQVAEGMVIATHLLMPGGERERVWLEDVALVQTDGATPLFTWDFAPL
ncbi:MAG: M24 family metallopeptidase, partial [Chromatiales bacterium]|nr:M24 family metallopeptidase [Chromatiales bacterium]